MRTSSFMICFLQDVELLWSRCKMSSMKPVIHCWQLCCVKAALLVMCYFSFIFFFFSSRGLKARATFTRASEPFQQIDAAPKTASCPCANVTLPHTSASTYQHLRVALVPSGRRMLGAAEGHNSHPPFMTASCSYTAILIDHS